LWPRRHRAAELPQQLGQRPSSRWAGCQLLCARAGNRCSASRRHRPEFAFSSHQAGSLWLARSNCGGKKCRPSLARANRFPADFIPTDRDGFACRQRPVRIRGDRRQRADRVEKLAPLDCLLHVTPSEFPWDSVSNFERLIDQVRERAEKGLPSYTSPESSNSSTGMKLSNLTLRH
jgi:hypothetical protein